MYVEILHLYAEFLLYMEIHGFTRTSAEIHWFTRTSMYICGNPVEIPGN